MSDSETNPPLLEQFIQSYEATLSKYRQEYNVTRPSDSDPIMVLAKAISETE